MPANLTQQYLKAEEAYRRATTLEEEVECLQLMLQEIPKHKGTDHLCAKLKTKLSTTKKEVVQDKQSGGKKGRGVRIPRQGAGTIVLLGGPNAGKSQFLNIMTSAEPEVANYPFTTHQPAPGMMPWNDVFVQLIDTPPITSDFLEAYMYGLIRGADLVLLLIDLGSDDGIGQCSDLLQRLDQTKTRLASTSYLDEEDIGLSFTKTFLVANKIDDPEAEDRLEIFLEECPVDFPLFKISAELEEGLEPLRDEIYKSLDVVRVYTKLPSAKEADRERPYTVKRDQSLYELAGMIHKDYAERFKFARVWGSQVHDATVVKSDYILHDGDVVELHM
jgi:uncharacterized protein